MRADLQPALEHDRLTHRRPLAKDVTADVGIGTMIVFIATILVAAIAAGVLISSSQKLQSKSTQTGNEAITNVAGTLNILNIQGQRSGTTGTDLIDQLDLTVQLAAGADALDFSTMNILFSDGTNVLNIDACRPGGVVTANTEFAMTVARGGATDCGFIESGDLVYLHLGLAGGSPIPIVPGGLGHGTQVQLQLVPFHGTPVLSRFVIPNLGSSKLVVIN